MNGKLKNKIKFIFPKLIRWNIFFYLYSEKLSEEFKEKNRGLYTDKNLSQLKITDLFIQNFNNQSNFLTQPFKENNFNNFNNNGTGFSANNDSGNFFNTQNLHPVNLSQNSKIMEGNSFGNSGGYQSEETKKIVFENKLHNNINNEVSHQFKPHNKIISRPFVTNVIPMSNNKNDSTNNKDFLNKIRRRSIKNNKIVFCHAQKSAARKFVTEVKVKIKIFIFFIYLNFLRSLKMI